MRLKGFSAALLVLLLVGTSSAEEQVQTIQLRWSGTRMKTEVLATSPYAKVAIRVVPFADLREHPNELSRSITKGAFGREVTKRFIPSGKPTVAEWMAEGFSRALTQFGIEAHTSTSIHLSGKILQLKLEESKTSSAPISFFAAISASISLTNASGNVLWEKTFSSLSENLGFQEIEPNYVVCLNEAARAIIYAALNDASLHQAVERAID